MSTKIKSNFFGKLLGNNWLGVLSFNLMMLLLSAASHAAGVVVDHVSLRRGAKVEEKKDNCCGLSIVRADENGISHNLLERMDLNGGALEIDNHGAVIAVENSDPLEGDTSLAAEAVTPAQTIILEIAGYRSSELDGTIKVLGEPARVIILNRRGIICHFLRVENVQQFELRVAAIREVVRGEIMWDGDGDGELRIAGSGVTVDGAMGLVAHKIKILGDLRVGQELKLDLGGSQSLMSGPLAEEEGLKTRVASGEIMGSRIRAGRISVVSAEPRSSFKLLAGEERGSALLSQGEIVISVAGNLQLGLPIWTNSTLSIVGKNIVFQAMPGESLVGKGCLAKGRLEVVGQNIEVQEGTALNSEDGLQLHGSKLTAAGSLSAGKSLLIVINGGVTATNIQAGKGLSLVAKGDVVVSRLVGAEGQRIEIAGDQIKLGEVSTADRLTLHGRWIDGQLDLQNVTNVEIWDQGAKKGLKGVTPFHFGKPLDLPGTFHLFGREMGNGVTLQAEGIWLNLSGNLTNSAPGKILSRGTLNLVGTHFLNLGKIQADGESSVMGETFINAGGAEFHGAGVRLYLRGKLADDNSFIQEPRAKIGAHVRGVDITAPSGSISFATQGRSGVGLVETGSSVINSRTAIKLQSGLDVDMAGAEVQGGAEVIANGKRVKVPHRVIDEQPS